MKRVIGYAEKKVGFWKLIGTSRIGNSAIGPDGMLNQSDQPTQFGHFSHLGPPSSAMGFPPHREDLYGVIDPSCVSIRF
jgi:hypothetical protein